MILLGAKEIADGGTLYTVSDDHKSLRFEIIRTDSLGFEMGGTSGKEIQFPLPLHREDGSPNENLVAACAVLRGVTIDIPDAYASTESGPMHDCALWVSHLEPSQEEEINPNCSLDDLAGRLRSL